MLILFLPLMGSISAGLLGRKLGSSGSQVVTIGCLALASLFALLAFYEVAVCASPVLINLGSWINSDLLTINWLFYFDQLTVTMLVIVSVVSLAVHIYSVYYMTGEPHQQRFFSYLSLFTFFMLVLVSGGNYLVLFLGWEGILNCLKWYNNEILNYNNYFFFSWLLSCYNAIDPIDSNIIQNVIIYPILNNTKLSSNQRIGPHNLDVISIIIGSILGDSHLEKRKNGLGTRIIFEQSNRNVEYLMWFHQFFANRGYCSSNIPKLNTRIREDGKITYHYRVSSYTFQSFNWIHEMFYKLNTNNKLIKIIPNNLLDYLTPLAIAIWFSDDGSKLKEGAKIATNCFTLLEVQFLCNILYQKYNLIATPQKDGKQGFTLYINKKSMPVFSNLIKPYMKKSLHYKLGSY